MRGNMRGGMVLEGIWGGGHGVIAGRCGCPIVEEGGGLESPQINCAHYVIVIRTMKKPPFGGCGTDYGIRCMPSASNRQ